MATVKTQGTEIFFIDSVTGQSDTLVKLSCPTGITGLGGAADQIDTTCLEATERTYVRGLANPGQVSVPFNFHPDETSHQVLFELKDDGSVLHWCICLSDGTTDPTLSGGAFSGPANRTNAKFDAYVADVNIDIATNEVVRGTLTLQRSDAVTWTFA